MKGLFRKIKSAAAVSFTKKELTIIVFLIVSFIAGLVIKYSGWKNPENYSYSESDKTFETQIKTAFDELGKGKLTSEQEKKINELKQFSDSLRVFKENTSQSSLSPDKKININTAYTNDLLLLPGIGEVMAERIIEYRERTGGFRNIEELKNVKGIGEKKFEKIRNYLTLE